MTIDAYPIAARMTYMGGGGWHDADPTPVTVHAVTRYRSASGLMVYAVLISAGDYRRVCRDLCPSRTCECRSGIEVLDEDHLPDGRPGMWTRSLPDDPAQQDIDDIILACDYPVP